MSAPDISGRKAEHIALCLEEHVESRTRSTLLDQVVLIHDSLPELAVDDIDLSTRFVGRTLPTPLMVSGMTGGIDEARRLNRVLARVAQAHGLAFGVGSQRPMLRDPATVDSYRVRDVAPDVFVCANIAAVQAAQMTTQELEDLAGAIDADALCLHLNPGQEMIQPGGDRDFRGCVDALRRAAAELSIPVIAKETGCGLGPRALAKIADAGVSAVDVSGAGGTTWIGVETLRAPGTARSVGEALWDWGVPTAASVLFASRAGVECIASGGIRDGAQAAAALALGASLAGAALPFLKAASSGGYDAASDVAETMLATLRTVMLLTGSADLAALRSAPRVLGPSLERWASAG